MQGNKIKLYEERDFGDKINATFTFLRQNFMPLGKSLLYIAGPLVVLVGIISALNATRIFFNKGEFSEQEAFSFAGSTGLISLFTMLSGALIIGIVYSYFSLYAERDDYDNITVSEVWARTQAHLLPILLSLVVMTILIFIGFVFLLIPGFILLAALSFIFILQVKERLSFGVAFSRCFRLVSDNYLSTLGLLLVMFILGGILGAVFGIPLLLISGANVFFSTSAGYDLQDSSVATKILFITAEIVSTLGTQFLYSISLIAIGYQYGNLVEKKEAAGLMQDIDTLGQQKPHSSEEESY